MGQVWAESGPPSSCHPPSDKSSILPQGSLELHIHFVSSMWGWEAGPSLMWPSLTILGFSELARQRKKEAQERL
jgi:hypothetical protein